MVGEVAEHGSLGSRGLTKGIVPVNSSGKMPPLPICQLSGCREGLSRDPGAD